MWCKGPHECHARLPGHGSRVGHNCSQLPSSSVHTLPFLFTPSVRVTIHDHASRAPRTRCCSWSRAGPLRSSLTNRYACAQLSRCERPPELHERTQRFVLEVVVSVFDSSFPTFPWRGGTNCRLGTRSPHLAWFLSKMIACLILLTISQGRL